MTTANSFTYAGTITDVSGVPALAGTVPFNLIGAGFNGLPKIPGSINVNGYDVINAFSAAQLSNLFFNFKQVGLNTRINIPILANSTNTSSIDFNPSGFRPTSSSQPEDRVLGTGVSGSLTSYRSNFDLNDLHPVDTETQAGFADVQVFYESSASLNVNNIKIIENNGTFLGYGFEELMHAVSIVTVTGDPSGSSYYQYQYTGIFGNIEDEAGVDGLKPMEDELHEDTLIGSNSFDTGGPTVSRSNITIAGVNFRQIRITHQFNRYSSGANSFTDVITGMAGTPTATADIDTPSFWSYS